MCTPSCGLCVGYSGNFLALLLCLHLVLSASFSSSSSTCCAYFNFFYFSWPFACVSSAIKTNRMGQKPKEQKMQIILRVEKGGRGGGQEDTCNSRLCCRTAKDNCFAVSAVSTATCDNRLVGSFVLVPSPELLLLLLYCSCWLSSCCSSPFYRLLLLLFLLFLLSVLAMAQHQHSGPKASLSAFLLNIYHLITI